MTSTADFAPAPDPGAAVDHWRRWCVDRLAIFELDAQRDPLTNSVRRLAHELAMLLASGGITPQTLRDVAQAFSDEAFCDRIRQFASARAEQNSDPTTIVAKAFSAFERADFATLEAAVNTARSGIVFTAHPTFAMSRALRREFAGRVERVLVGEPIDEPTDLPHAPNRDLSLVEEHEDSQRAIANAQLGLEALNRAILEWARARFPADWSRLRPGALSVATWVGYDLDGRTDIHWSETFRLRLQEKALQLARYADRLAAVGVPGAEELVRMLRKASGFASEQSALFAADFADPAVVTAAANALTRADPRRLVSLDEIRRSIDALIASETSDAARRELALICADMKAYGLGVARIHLRINAAQIRSALRADLGLDADRDFVDRTALTAASEKARSAAQRKVNLVSLFLEQMTARRQFMLCAQFLKHIDADTPIRFLIAECDAPAVVMGAIYLARLYGVDDHLDISPLFETPEALERGGRFLERLLADDEFLSYIRARGRLAIQLGFSDSGRFMGQIAANLVIERLQILLARALSHPDVKDKVEGIEVVLFNTHGESMGRGGFPGSLADRCDYVLTPWTRARYAHDGRALNAEMSFQGGDGYLHFETPRLAASTLAAVFEWTFRAPHKDEGDRFYEDINYSWDLYRGVKAWQEALFDSPDYQTVIGAFGPSLLFTTGSRKVRRQSGSGVSIGPRSLRAIPHNAILQQLAAPVNVSGGVGAGAGPEADRLVDLVRNSARMRQVFRLVRHARALTSLPVLRAYGSMFDASYWVARAATADRDDEAGACERLAGHLAAQIAPTAFARLANALALDVSRLDRVFDALDGAETRRERHAARRPLHALHAVRMALILRALTLVAGLPAFSQRHDVGRSAVLDLAVELRFDALADLLSTIFPAVEQSGDVFAGVDEPGDEANGSMRGYPEIHEKVIRPLRETYDALREIGVGIAHYYGAYG